MTLIYYYVLVCKINVNLLNFLCKSELYSASSALALNASAAILYSSETLKYIHNYKFTWTVPLNNNPLPAISVSDSDASPEIIDFEIPTGFVNVSCS